MLIPILVASTIATSGMLPSKEAVRDHVAQLAANRPAIAKSVKTPQASAIKTAQVRAPGTSTHLQFAPTAGSRAAAASLADQLRGPAGN